ncbi:hypothetical protein AVEN_192881-1 [Araneus ventricosus]|uniref:Uncharacterized protein n=1 Tax=Araneus ventricosus TaxID=182803 RepID=A0A4Y2Q0C2_ARAVE|nr:hypothetical protein AVEN_192881-1 [Araneus ventricosus]
MKWLSEERLLICGVTLIFATLQRVGKFDPGTSCISRVVWQRLIDRVKEKVSKLVLPESLKERMMYLVRPVDEEILRWKLFHEYILSPSHVYLVMHILEQLCWTCIGAVDYQKTAEELVCLESLDVVNAADQLVYIAWKITFQCFEWNSLKSIRLFLLMKYILCQRIWFIWSIIGLPF